MNILISFLVLLIIIVYIKHTIQINNTFEIIQTEIESLHPSMIDERLPIIISESMVNPYMLTKTTFAYRFLFTYNFKNESVGKLIKNNNKYLIMYHDSPTVIDVYHPNYENQDNLFIQMKLKEKQVLILPMQWYYRCHSPTTCIALNDILSTIVKFII